MAIRRVSTASIKTGSKSNKFWDQDTAQGAIEPIGSWTLSNAEVYSFSNIPQTYQDLMIVISGVVNPTDASMALDNWHGSQTANRSFTMMGGNGTTVLSSRNSNIDNIPLTIVGGIVNSSVPTSAVIHILNYANTTTNKTILFRSANDLNGSGHTTLGVGLIRSTSGVNFFNITTQVVGKYWTAATRVTIYGIKAGA